MCFNVCLYQHSRFVVNVVLIKVTLSIIGLDNSSYSSIQGDVRFGISGEYQKVWGIRTPANPLLMMTGTEISKERLICIYVHSQFCTSVSMCMCICMWLHLHTLHTTACMTASNPPSGASLFLDTCCFPTSSVKRATRSVSDSTLMNPNWAWHCSLILNILKRWTGIGKSVKEKTDLGLLNTARQTLIVKHCKISTSAPSLQM